MWRLTFLVGLRTGVRWIPCFPLMFVRRKVRGLGRNVLLVILFRFSCRVGRLTWVPCGGRRIIVWVGLRGCTPGRMFTFRMGRGVMIRRCFPLLSDLLWRRERVSRDVLRVRCRWYWGLVLAVGLCWVGWRWGPWPRGVLLFRMMRR